MARVPEQMHASIGLALRPRPGDESRLCFAEARISETDDGGQLLERVVILEGRQRPHLIQPLAQLAGRLVRRGSRQPEAFQIDEAAHALRPQPRIQAGNVAAHAVSDDAEPARPGSAAPAAHPDPRGNPETSSRSGAQSLRPKPRQSGATSGQSCSNASTMNWNVSPVSCQPCSRSTGATRVGGLGPQRVRCISSPRTRRVSCRGRAHDTRSRSFMGGSRPARKIL